MHTLLYKKYDQYKQLLDTKLRQDVSQGSYVNEAHKAYKCFAENLQTDHRKQVFSVC
ncbi:hypothetical protein PROFUN_07081 [Planoprotostelium fungivorum]|uniref:Uncharacterized protein n=1 Tax=Planoprotostelium fungivorum TaxID=1890364 RepID=A0A2P6NN23_9EUKA|nr:hypothetical protein PROFUN_07081 [Planoprotostelium fungivorum]